MLDTLAHCAELVTQREEAWRKRLERETERRRRCECLSKSYFEQLQKMRVIHSGPDLEVSKKVKMNKLKKQVSNFPVKLFLMNSDKSRMI